MKRVSAVLLCLALVVGLCPAVFAEEAPAFTDVQESNYYYEPVYWAVENGITTGVSPTQFGASGIVNRAQAVTFLWRLAGAPAPAKDHGFKDVPAGKWYADAVNWAAENGIVNGYSDKVFAPFDACTRQQAAAILYRYEELRGGGFQGAWAFEMDFTDRRQISKYAYEALCWITMKGVMQGYHGALDPKGLCQRAQFVTMLYRFAADTPAASAQELSFAEKEVPVVRDSLDSNETATLRYYADMPNVPYMKLTDFYNRFYLAGTERAEGMSETQAGSRSAYENFGGYTLTADADNDVLYTDDLESFTIPGYYIELAITGENDEFYPFLLQNSLETDPETPVPLTLRLGNYGIDLRMGEDGLYFPVGTLCDLFAGSTVYYVVCNGEKLYVVDYLTRFQDNNALYEDEHFSDGMAAGRHRDMADFNYRQLCFTLDVFYGRPGKEYIHDAMADSGLDKVLNDQFPEIKDLLLSLDATEYFGGLYHLLWGLFFDGGHTVPISRMIPTIGVSREAISSLFDAPYITGLYAYYNRQDVLYELYPLQQELYGDDYYAELGDTAMIRFEGFDVDSDGWKAYYAGEGELPLEDDTLGTVYAGLQRAAANPEIKNVILDISTNPGGDSAALNAIQWLMTGEGYLIYRNRLSGQTYRESYLLDANFDGVFDEQDQPITQFHYGVLTSAYSFSCANYFPFVMQANGAMVLGEQSGGGACCVRITSTADGFEIYSSYAGYVLISDDLQSVDEGCPVDKSLVQDGDAPYALFYDLSVLSAAMNEFFAEE